MKIDHYIDLKGKPGVSGLIYASGSFGAIGSDADYMRTDEEGRTVFSYENGSVRLESEFVFEENGVVLRRDRFYNCSDAPLEVDCLLSRFALPGNEYEVYTQYNGWQHESTGAWQKLVTRISAISQGIRTCDGATPIMGFHDLYTGKNTVFHLLPNAQWQMSVQKFPRSDRERVVLECGLYDRSLCLSVAQGECIELPPIVFFQAESKTDLDAYKLHAWFLGKHPRKRLPVFYNSWMYCYANLDVDALIRQVDCAADMGFEGFMIDAGWFGRSANWGEEVGDWVENTESGPCGRLIEVSDRVRERGMIFGLWFEPERAAKDCRAVREHPEYYISGKYLDFSNPDAVAYMLEVISSQIDKYHVGWVKFDFNSTIPQDPSKNAFYRYMQGQKDFIRRLRERYPELYITNCASGGFRMELGQAEFSDSFWLSDNQGPYEGIRIVKDTLKRMPSALIERWNVQKYCDGFLVYPDKRVGRMIHCNDGTWESLIGVSDSFSEEFLKGGPMGFSCDLSALPEEYHARWSQVIAEYKRDAEFYANALARVTVDTDRVTVLEYFDRSLDRLVIQIFTKTVYAEELLIYPTVDREKQYLMGDQILDGKSLTEDGILIRHIGQNACRVLELTAK